MANRLVHEKSPYLLQHAHNPVDWYAWGEEAFEKARREDKPIFLSVGYSTCHWCHVMERESFESEEIAAILNRFFVPVKLDREERPDVDRVYMTFVQATTGGGGWPMSVWLTPDGKPFFGGTYFPPDDRYGRPGFARILNYIAGAWASEREKIQRSGEQILAQLKRGVEEDSGRRVALDQSVLESGFQVFRRSFDGRLGGFGGAPKFPRPVVHNFLLRYYASTGNREALDMVLETLRQMARGGMYDQLGGGFHRYSVDERWFVPHFEKMLYDQAQLVISYLEAFQISGDDFFATVARDVLDYVLRDMTHPQGGFYSAEDADSVIDPAQPHNKGEGAFYIWAYEELAALLGRPLVDWFCYRYGVEPEGNVRSDPHGEFTGRNILYQAHSIGETARRFQLDEAEVARAMADARLRLMEARSRRVRPHRDDKILCSWNGLMISAFALAAQVLDEARYEEAARRATEFILANLYMPGEQTLLRRWRDGEAAIKGFLDDYAFFIQALLDLYETSFDPAWLEKAVDLARTMVERFEDPVAGGFFSSAGEDDLVLRIKDDYDGAEPSGNSVAALVLLRLAEMTARQDFARAATRTLEAFSQRLAAAPVALPQMLVAMQYSMSKPKQIIVAGNRDQARPLLRALRRRFLPHRFVMLVDGEADRQRLASLLPAVAGMTPIDGRPAAYVCENYACRLPVTEVNQLEELLQ